MIRIVLAVVLLTLPYIGLTLTLPLPGWQLDAPIADLAAIGLILALPWLRGTVAVPAPRAFAVLVGVGVFTALVGTQPLPSLKWVIRQPVFLYVAYLLALPAALERAHNDVRPLLWASVAITAVVALAAGVPRILSGWGTWWSDIAGLTPNHKTLAVWMAPLVPWLWLHRKHPVGRVVGVLAAASLLVSSSKAAWIATGLALAWQVRWRGRPLVTRWRATILVIGLAVITALYAPVVLGSRTMLDAARSRHSLNVRSAWMLQNAPLTGQGPGSSLVAEMVEFPHYRINGVDAHGVLQKVAAEQGLLGLLAWLGFTGTLGMQAVRRYREDPSDVRWTWLGTGAVLHFNLLLSTESFTQTHWGLLGVAWWGLHRDRDAALESGESS